MSSTASSNASRNRTRKRARDGCLPYAKRARNESITFTDSESEASSSYASCSTVSISPAEKDRLEEERSRIEWIPREFGLVKLSFSLLMMERVLKPESQARYIDTTYCDRNILESLMEAKATIKRTCESQYDSVRKTYNDFEFERGAIFHHGAAIKIANIDALMEHALTNPKNIRGESLILPNELLYFADLYGGPGGCAEYILWKKKWHAKGFGLSPRGKYDYNLLQAEHYPLESFEPYYGDDGINGSGDIRNPYNLVKFVEFIRQSTDGVGVHFVMASGADRGDSVDEDKKELHCKYLFMSEFLCALRILRQGKVEMSDSKNGHYVCRLYDSFTPFTVGLIYLMYRCFEHVAIFKPESTLPASSERYVICKWRKPEFHTSEIANYLATCHKMDWHTRRQKKHSSFTDKPIDIIQLVSSDRITDTRAFYEYIYKANTELGRRQYYETKYLIQKMQDNQESNYVSEKLRLIQVKCNDQWQIPKKCRQMPKYAKASTADLRAMKLVIPYSFDFYRDCESKGEIDLTRAIMEEEITHPTEWSFITVGRMRGFYLCLGGTQNYRFKNGSWTKVNENEKIELMNNTLVYGDLVDEVKANGANQVIITGFHIIDALILGGTDIRHLAASERFDLIKKYAHSMNKISRPDLAKIRAKPRYELKSFLPHMEKVQESVRIRNRESDVGPKFLAPVFLHRLDDTVYCPDGIVFLKSVKEKFAPADAQFCLMNRLFWHWTCASDVKPPQDNDDVEIECEDTVSTITISQHFNKIT